jgi:mono/diheme cytochrome c family protein
MLMVQKGFVLVTLLMASFSSMANNGAMPPQEAQSVICQDQTPDCLVRLHKTSSEASIFRGKIVYHNYCVICHGKEYDGNGRVAKIHNPKPVNLLLSRLPQPFVNDIVRQGGEAVGRYKGMPPFEEQLTEEQLTDVQNFILFLRTQ